MLIVCLNNFRFSIIPVITTFAYMLDCHNKEVTLSLSLSLSLSL